MSEQYTNPINCNTKDNWDLLTIWKSIFNVSNGSINTTGSIPEWLTDKLLFLGYYSDISGGQMPNRISGLTDYLTVSGIVGSETYQVPNTAAYIAADTDFIWFNRNGQVRITDTIELVGYDLPRTLVKYDNSSPYQIRIIAILKAGETLTAAELDYIHTFFELALFWSGVENVNGFVKGNRGLVQSVWTAPSVAALAYSDTYQTAVLADGGTIENRNILESEYQRLIDTGNILSCWFSYHYQCGVKKSLVDYGLGDVDMVYKWYNLSPVAGRFAESVRAYNIISVGDARAEYTSDGLRFRPINLDGGVRCGLESPSATILPNNNGIIKIRGIVKPLNAGALQTITGKGFLDANGFISETNTALYKIATGFYGAAAARSILSTAAFFTINVESEFSSTLDFIAETITLTRDDSAVETINIGVYNPDYPVAGIVDMVGHGRTSGRNSFEGYIKQIEMFNL